MFKEVSYTEDFGRGASITLKAVEGSGVAKVILETGDVKVTMTTEEWSDLRNKTDKLFVRAIKDGIVEGNDLTDTLIDSQPGDIRCPEYSDHKCAISDDACDDGYLPCELFESVHEGD